MGFPQPTISIFDGVISANRFVSWVQTVDVLFNLPLAQGQSVTDAHLDVQVTVGPHIAEGTVTLFMNGSYLGAINIDGFQIYDLTKHGSFNVPTGILKGGSNKVTIKCDTGDPTASLDFTTTCTMAFSTNTDAPVNGTVTGSNNSGNPPNAGGSIFGNTFDFLKDPFSKANIVKTVIFGAGVAIVGIVVVKAVSGGRSLPIIIQSPFSKKS